MTWLLFYIIFGRNSFNFTNNCKYNSSRFLLKVQNRILSSESQIISLQSVLPEGGALVSWYALHFFVIFIKKYVSFTWFVSFCFRQQLKYQVFEHLWKLNQFFLLKITEEEKTIFCSSFTYSTYVNPRWPGLPELRQAR